MIRSLLVGKNGFKIEEGGNSMGNFGGFYKGDKKKQKKSDLEKKAQKAMSGNDWQLPQVEIIKKGKKEW
jgi:hypothetical protein